MTQNENAGHAHREAFEWLPWLVNGNLDASSAIRVRRHADTCLACRRELQFLEALQKEIAAEEPAPVSMVAALESFNRRLDAAQARPAASLRDRLRQRLARFARPSRRTLYIALAAQAALIVVGALVIAGRITPDPAPAYRTLATPDPALTGPALRVVFSPETPVSGIMQALATLGGNARVVSGPSPVGVFTIALDAPDPDLMRLRAQPGVQFAEFIGGEEY